MNEATFSEIVGGNEGTGCNRSLMKVIYFISRTAGK